MKPETIKKIRDLLRTDVKDKEGRMLEQIRSGFITYVDDRITEYRESYNALQDFDDWVEEQEDD